jgi:hypothetical protein
MIEQFLEIAQAFLDHEIGAETFAEQLTTFYHAHYDTLTIETHAHHTIVALCFEADALTNDAPYHAEAGALYAETSKTVQLLHSLMHTQGLQE